MNSYQSSNADSSADPALALVSPAVTEIKSTAAAEIDHKEPEMGGSYTRDLGTGALVKAEPVATAKPEQE